MWGIAHTHLSLEEYAEWVQMPEPFLYGIRNHPDLVEGKGCGDYWDQSDRVYLANAIAKSEKRLKSDRWLGFPIRREYNDGGSPRQLDWSWPAYLGKYLRGIGVEAEDDVQNGVVLDLRGPGQVINDPVIILVNVLFTDANELLIYYPGQRTYTIRPSRVILSGGVATIEIPRSRLLAPEYFTNYNRVSDRPDYQDDSYFISTVDIVRNYLDATTGANLVWRRRFPGSWSNVCDTVGACDEILQLACGYVRNQRDGIVQFEPATYTDGVWARSNYAVRRCPDGIQVNFMRFRYDRYDPMDEDLVRAIIAVAHNNMPQDPCLKCAVSQHYYRRDVSPLEPPVSLGLGPSTWGIYEACQIIREYDARHNGAHGGLL